MGSFSYKLTTETGAFLTKKEADKYIENFKHHHTNAQTYGMTAVGNNELETLLNIIKTTNWNEMLNNWSIVCIEPNDEGVSIYTGYSQTNISENLQKMWKNHINTEEKESSRKINYEKSFCDNLHAEIWYTTGQTPIKYFAEEITQN